MPLIKNQTFNSQRIVLDDAEYEGCTFTKCDIVYRGGSMSTIKCRFEECRYHFEDAAALTVLVLRGLYNMEGDGSGRRIVENLLKDAA